MSWKPSVAKKLLDKSVHLENTRGVKKIEGYKFKSQRELVLATENLSKVVVYTAIAPFHMPGVNVEQEYLPTKVKSGRHADIEAVARTLGYSFKAYRLHIESAKSMETLVEWLKHA